MARNVISLGVFVLGLIIAAPANAHQHTGGYTAVSQMQIDPNMSVLSDGPAEPANPAASQTSQDKQAAGTPLDQLGADASDAPVGDDPAADNAVETDTVYTA